jgi:hypothetical protein
MATFKKIATKEGIAWMVDYYDPQGRRIKKRFKKKAEAEAYLAKVVTTIKEEKYEAISETERKKREKDYADEYKKKLEKWAEKIMERNRIEYFDGPGEAASIASPGSNRVSACRSHQGER